MATYNLTDDFAPIAETTGTLQNLSERVNVEIATAADAPKNSGLLIYPRKSIRISSQIYARSENGENVEARVVPFEDGYADV